MVSHGVLRMFGPPYYCALEKTPNIETLRRYPNIVLCPRDAKARKEVALTSGLAGCYVNIHMKSRIK